MAFEAWHRTCRGRAAQREHAMPAFVYLLCALTSIFCAALLIRSYTSSRHRLLLWASLCFVGLAVNNVLLFVDLILVRQLDLSLWRTAAALAGLVLMVFGLIWEAK
jgi:hypothetical protein